MGGFSSGYAAQPEDNGYAAQPDFIDEVFQPHTNVEEPQLKPVGPSALSSYAAQPDNAGEPAPAPVFALRTPPQPMPAPRPFFGANIKRIQAPKPTIKDRIGFWNSRNLPDLPLLRPDACYKNEEATQNIKYIRSQWLRRKYEVSIGAVLRRGGEIFDTPKIKAFYQHKAGSNVGGRLTPADKAKPFEKKPRAKTASATMGDGWKELAVDWVRHSLIWVCAMEHGRARPSFYSSIGKNHASNPGDPHGFKHSSFKAGGAVICAGEWIVSSGKLLKISANSGHYRPSIDYLHRAVQHMAEAWNEDTVVLLWNIKEKAWEEVPVLTFRDNPTLNGTYRAHAIG